MAYKSPIAKYLEMVSIHENGRRDNRRELMVNRVPKDVVDDIVADTVSLIKTVPEEYKGDIASRIKKVLRRQMYPDSLVDWLIDECDLTEARAELIVSDQIRKCQERLRLHLLRKRRINFVVWRHAGAEKDPRDYHARKWDGKSGIHDGHPNGLDGYPFPISSPPVIDEKTLERGYPSDLIGCKCRLAAINMKV